VTVIAVYDRNDSNNFGDLVAVQKLWVLGKRQEAKGKREEKQVYLTSLGNAIIDYYSFLILLTTGY